MSAKKKINKDDIINGAFEVLREQGEVGLNARGIAAHIGCSTQPLYCEFQNMKELRTILSKKIDDFWWEKKNELLKKNEYPIPISWYLSFLYIAKNEKNLFRYRYLTLDSKDHSPFLGGIFPELLDYIAKDCNISRDEAEVFHKNIIVFLLGLGVLVNTGDSDISDEDCVFQLQRIYEANKILVKNSKNAAENFKDSFHVADIGLDPLE